MAITENDLLQSTVGNANTEVLHNMILGRMFPLLENKMRLGMFWKKYPDDVSNRKFGGSFRVRKPVYFIADDEGTSVDSFNSREATPQPIEEGTWEIKVDKRAKASINFTQFEKGMSLMSEDIKKYVDNMCMAIVNEIDANGAEQYRHFPNYVEQLDTDGTFLDTIVTPDKKDVYFAAAARLNALGVPMDMRKYFLTPLMMSSVALALGDNTYSEMITEEAVREGTVGRLHGAMLDWTQNIATHTVGDYAGTPRIDGATGNVSDPNGTPNQYEYTEITTDGWTSSGGTTLLNAGDIITISGVKAVNYPSRRNMQKKVLGHDQQFTVVEDVVVENSTTAATDVKIKVSPPILIEGPFQTVATAPADDATITVRGSANSTRQEALIARPDAIGLICPPLATPQDGLGVKSTVMTKNGLSVRVQSWAEGKYDVESHRVDVIYGYNKLYADFQGVRIGSAT